MKRIISIALLLILALTLVSGCAKKTTTKISINAQNVKSVNFKCAYFGGDKIDYKQKIITQQSDIKTITDWLGSLQLEKAGVIEIPAEKITYYLQFKGAKEHKVIFMDEFIIFDKTAYTFKKSTQQNSVVQKYNLFNYPEQDTTLGLL